MLSKLVVFSLVLLVLSACGGSESDKILGSNGEITILEGTWKKSCSAVDPSDEATLYDVVIIKFTYNLFESDILNYSDSACSMPLLTAANPVSSGTFALGGTIETSSGLSAFELDTHITQFNGAPFDIDDYTVVYVASSILYLGDDTGANDGSSIALRSNELNFNRIYNKQ